MSADAALQPSTPYRPLLTASGIDRFFACPGSATLPKVHDATSAAARRGTDEHFERLQPGRLPEKVLAWFGGKEPLYEVAMAADCAVTDRDDVSTVTYVGQYVERGYPPMPGPAWLAGTADMLGVVGDVLSVGDLKTGRGQSRGSLPSPEESGQLLSLAWMAVRLKRRGAREKGNDWTPSRIRLMWWLTGDADGDTTDGYLVDAEVTWPQLREWAKGLCREVVYAAIGTGSAHLRRSSYCTGCSSFDACPAQGGAVRRVLTGRHDGGVELSDSDLVAAWHDVKAALRICETASTALEMRVGDGAVDAGDGHCLRAVRGTTTRIDPAVAAGVLGDRLLSCATLSVSQAGIKRGVGDDAAKVLQDIEARGGVVKVASQPYLRLVRKGK